MQKVKTQHVTTKSVHTVDSFAKRKDKETGKIAVVRWQEDRQVGATLQTSEDGGVFHRGARIA